jgi:hypothetical protein
LTPGSRSLTSRPPRSRRFSGTKAITWLEPSTCAFAKPGPWIPHPRTLAIRGRRSSGPTRSSLLRSPNLKHGRAGQHDRLRRWAGARADWCDGDIVAEASRGLGGTGLGRVYHPAP